jgi:hypothetical protein
MIEAPPDRQIDSWLVAEENAAQWMRYWGHIDAACTSGGSDGGVDVRSSTSLAQVKFEAVQVGSPAVQRLVGARGRQHHLALFFFSGAGYARPAIDYGDGMDVALFKYDLIGHQMAVNQTAREVVRVCTLRLKNLPTAQAVEWSWTDPRKPTGQNAWPRLITDVSSGLPTTDRQPPTNPLFSSALSTPGVADALARGKKSEATRRYRKANPRIGWQECVAIIDVMASSPRGQALKSDS